MNNLLKFAGTSDSSSQRDTSEGSLLKSGGENDISHHAGAKQANILGSPLSDPQTGEGSPTVAPKSPH